MKEKTKAILESLTLALKDPTNPEYFSKDIELAKKYSISRHSVYKIRDTLQVGPRKARLNEVLKSIDTQSMTLKEISERLNIKYQNLYKLVEEFKVPYKKRDAA